MHIRRGDYLELPQVNICTRDYYMQAMQKMKALRKETKFIVFSDDKEWIENNFDMQDMVICTANLFDKYEDWYDMYLMSCCNGNIIANSSFSWWGAWLNQNKDKIVIAPSVWNTKRNTPDVWCEDWIKQQL